MRLLVLLSVLLQTPLLAFADSWSFPPELDATEYVFGDTRIVRILDAREDHTHPDFRIDVYRDEELVGRYGGQYFDEIAASADNDVFVGISNRGLPHTAIIIFDADGVLRGLVNHDMRSERFIYCKASVTLVRQWYDSEDSSLRFVQNDNGDDIQVRGCHGEMISVLEMLR